MPHRPNQPTKVEVGFQVAHAKIPGMGSLFCGAKLVAVLSFNHGKWYARNGGALSPE